MARIVYSALVESIRGSIGGTTFQRNAYGYTVKKKPNIVSPNTPAQNFQKVVLNKAVKDWNELTNSQRTDWNTWASTYPQYAKNNPSSQLSGYNVYVRRRVYNIMAGLNGPVVPLYYTPDEDTLTYTLSESSGTLTLGITSLNDDEAWGLFFFLSRPFTATQNFVGTATRWIRYYTNVDGNYNITSLYVDVFGKVATTGQRVAVDVVQCALDNGIVKAKYTEVLTVG